jgi:hypothetical protein
MRTLKRLIARFLLLAIFASVLTSQTGRAKQETVPRPARSPWISRQPILPVIVNAMFTERTANRALDPLPRAALCLDDGTTRIAIAVVDTCMMPRDLLDRAKESGPRSTGIATDHMLISATHTHSGASAMGCLGRADPDYVKFLPGRIAEGIEQRCENLAPARMVGGDERL